MLRRGDIPVLLGLAGGAAVEWVDWDGRTALAEVTSGGDTEYLGYEFTDPDRRRLLYIEEVAD